MTKSKKIKSKKLKTNRNSNIAYNMNGNLPVIDKEGLLMKILQSRNEIELMDMELFRLKKKRKKLQQKFLANKLIIEGVLNIEDEQDDNNIKSNNLEDEKHKTSNNYYKIKLDEK